MSTAHPRLGDVFPELSLLKNASGLKPGTLIKHPSEPPTIVVERSVRNQDQCNVLRNRIRVLAMDGMTVNEIVDSLQQEYAEEYGKIVRKDFYFQVYYHLVQNLRIPANPELRVYPHTAIIEPGADMEPAPVIVATPEPEPETAAVNTSDTTYDFSGNPAAVAQPYAKAIEERPDTMVANVLVQQLLPPEIAFLTGGVDGQRLLELAKVQKQVTDYYREQGFEMFIRHKDGGPYVQLKG